MGNHHRQPEGCERATSTCGLVALWPCGLVPPPSDGAARQRPWVTLIEFHIEFELIDASLRRDFSSRYSLSSSASSSRTNSGESNTVSPMKRAESKNGNWRAGHGQPITRIDTRPTDSSGISAPSSTNSRTSRMSRTPGWPRKGSINSHIEGIVRRVADGSLRSPGRRATHRAPSKPPMKKQQPQPCRRRHWPDIAGVGPATTQERPHPVGCGPSSRAVQRRFTI